MVMSPWEPDRLTDRLIPRRRGRRSVPAVLGAALATGVLAVTAAGDSGPRPPHTAGDAVDDAVDDAAPPATTPAPPPPRRPPSAWTTASAALAEELRPLEAAPEVRLAVTVLDPLTGRSLTYGSGHFDTASVVKVDVVAALLLAAQDEGRPLTDRERRLATDAIRISDNEATHELWRLIGGPAGLEAANARLGLRETVGGGDGHWGLTQTTTADRIALLRAVFGPRSPLDGDSRRLLQQLMGSVAEGQNWGISAAAREAADGSADAVGAPGTAPHADAAPLTGPDGAGPALADGLRRDTPDETGPGTALKNGWLPRSHTQLWNINSIGRVTVAGHPYLLAVLSAGHRTSEEGIAVVEAAARAAVDVIRSASAA